jgi:hypothetical protein
MIDDSHVPPVEGYELLARFIVNGNEVRADGTVRPQLFLPYKRVELSVNRHRDATLEETTNIGRQVAAQRGKTLIGREDIRARSCCIHTLSVIASPILPGNPNHADIVGYPTRKDEQLSLAAKLAASIESLSPLIVTDSKDSENSK